MNTKQFRTSALTFGIIAGAAFHLHAQDAQKVDLSKLDPSKMKPEEIQKVLAENPPLFLKVAVKQAKWNDATDPLRIAGPIYFVGTRGLAVWLIKTSEGLILMNTAMPGSGPMTEASIRKLGFKPEDIKLLLTCHAHIDHVGAHNYFKKLAGAQVAIIDIEKENLESGGKTDFFYAAFPEFLFEPVKADRVFKDGEVIKLGDVALTAQLTPGHSKGATTWTMNIEDGGKTYSVVFPDGSGVNPGFRVAVKPSYPGIGDNYQHTIEKLAAMKPDIWLAAHTEKMGFEAKAAKAATEGAKAWVDPDGYAKFIAEDRTKFEAEVKAEEAAAKK